MTLIDYNAGLIDGLEGVLSALIRNGKSHLGPIKGYASLIQDDTDDQSNSRRWADKIMRNVREMEDHLHALGMFRLKEAIGESEISWHRIVCEVMDRLAAVNAKGVPIAIANEVHGTFHQHKELLKRVLVHLVVNAYESIEQSGKIALTIEERDREDDGRRKFAVWITDNGCGMTGEVMKRSWTPFFTTKQNHIGLGLPYVAAAASVTKMAVEVASTKGLGTTVGLIITETGG